jgi:hypothetical protein
MTIQLQKIDNPITELTTIQDPQFPHMIADMDSPN